MVEPGDYVRVTNGSGTLNGTVVEVRGGKARVSVKKVTLTVPLERVHVASKPWTEGRKNG